MNTRQGVIEEFGQRNEVDEPIDRLIGYIQKLKDSRYQPLHPNLRNFLITKGVEALLEVDEPIKEIIAIKFLTNTYSSYTQ